MTFCAPENPPLLIWLSYLAMFLRMRRVKIGEFRNQVSSYVRQAERGETIAILRRNREVALLQPSKRHRVAAEKLLGCLKGTARVLVDLDRVRIPEGEWFKGS